ncbi:MAG: hypothetical protein MUE81_16310 [Thermoflexibacter sp.]|jgi:hypothetical protein|nr:hypothetical protein [Thermoflexibacter sp.]
MNYSIKSIPTHYKGRLYRSRLEARWAAFFDLAEWKTEYEPIDLSGWSPDFLIDEAMPILAEVKPHQSYFQDENFYFDFVDEGVCQAILLLTNEIYPYQGIFARREHELFSIGKIIMKTIANERLISPAVAGVFWGNAYRLGLCIESDNWQDLITGQQGECFIIDNGEVPFIWQEAANRTMFLKPQPES